MDPLISDTTTHLFRHESGKMVAVLSKLLGLGQMEVAQDLVQDTLLQAMQTWSYGGLPDNPSAWLYRVARNKATDYLRREKRFKHLQPRYAYLLESEYSLSAATSCLFSEEGIQDNLLQMMFACCHPAIPPGSQLALSLKTLCGLSAAEIAGALLTSEETISKRIYRAREKLKAENIQLEMPPPSQLPARLDTVLQMLYLLFNEGYLSSHSSHIIREELCEEAMRLTYQLTLHARTALPQTFALLALFCFQASRLKARVDDRGAIVLLQQQDRSLWYRPLIEKGSELLDVATASGGSSAYHFEAAIAAIHASAPSFAQTDWTSIYRLYQLLYAIRPGAIVSMNMAVAAAYAGYPQEGLQQLLATGGLEHHHLYHACLGELYATLQDKEKAGAHLHHALRLAPSLTEQALLRRKLEAL